MIEIVLIIILGLLVILLSALILIRRNWEKGKVLLSEDALNDLVAGMVNNIKAGKIQDIAGRVSVTLKKYLDCDKIIFLKQNKGQMELNYYHGIQKFEREEFRLKMNQNLQNRLRAFHTVSPLKELMQCVPAEYIRRMEELGLNYFFPVYLRDTLYGLYFIRTTHDQNNPVLRFLATALAFNLSAAYHIGIQEQQLRKYEDRLKSVTDAREKDIYRAEPFFKGEFQRLLKIRDSRQLIPELMTALRKECGFSRMIFITPSFRSDEAVISINWNLDDSSDRIFKDNFNLLTGKLQADKICELKDASQQIQPVAEKLNHIRELDLRFLTTLSWPDNRKAILAWNGQRSPQDIQSRLQKFKAEAWPLIENVGRFEKVEELSYTDGLTGIYNFRFFQKRIREEFDRAKRYSRSMALLIFDIDDLKTVNDRLGHQVGDQLLRSFGEILTESVRTNDMVSRYGGDEFCLIMPETNREKVRLFMDRIREKIARNPLEVEGLPEQNYSVSIGGAVFPEDAEDIDSLIKAADMALLKAKGEGRNCSRLYLPEYSRRA